MNKEQYLSSLERELHLNKVEDIDEIIAEYEEHFARKLSDGYAEEEIAAKLVKPQVIAKQFVLDTGAPKGAPVLAKIGMGFLDTIMILFDAALYAFAGALGAGAIGLLAGGIYMLFFGGSLFFAPMPVTAGILIGVAMIALSVLTGAGTMYYTLYLNQLNKAYFRWHKKVMTGHPGPSYGAMPALSGKLRRRLRRVTLISLLVFIILFVAGYVYMSIAAGAPGFWHAWHWFA